MTERNEPSPAEQPEPAPSGEQADEVVERREGPPGYDMAEEEAYEKDGE